MKDKGTQSNAFLSLSRLQFDANEFSIETIYAFSENEKQSIQSMFADK